MTSFVLIVEATVDDEELFDPVAVHAALQLMQLSNGANPFVNPDQIGTSHTQRK